jgi:hypothetical protein
LQGSEEGADESFFLVVEVLADAFTNGNARAFEFQDAQGNTVDVENNIRAFFVFAFDGDFLGDRKVVIFRMLPVDQPDSLILLCPFFGFDSIA